MGHAEWGGGRGRSSCGSEDWAASHQPLWWPCGPTCGCSPSQGLDQSQQSLEAIFALQELICLKDPALLSLEVLGFITKYPDVR